MTKDDKKAAKYTHSVWTGKKYARPQTHAELLAESVAIVRRHPTMGFDGSFTMDKYLAQQAAK